MYPYNTYGQITAMDSPRTDTGDLVGFSYYPNDAAQGNNRGNLQTVADALGHVTTYGDYNAFGQVETITDPNGIVKNRTYNGSDILVSTTTGLATGNQRSMTLACNLVKTISDRHADRVQYDALRRLLSVTEAGDTAVYGYADHGNIT